MNLDKERARLKMQADCVHDKIIRSTVWWICGRCDKTIEPVTDQMSIYDYQ